MFIGSFDDEEEEEEESKEIKEENNSKKAKVNFFNFDPHAIYNEGKTFSFLDKSDNQDKLPQAKDWKQIAFDFLSNNDEFLDIGTNDSFEDIDTTRADEFVVGQGATNWGEIRRKAIENSKEKKRRSRK